MPQSKKLFRPYLTEEEIFHLAYLCSEYKDKLSKEIHKKLMKYKLSISHELISPSYTSTNDTPSIEESLGLELPDDKDNSGVTKAEKYNKKLSMIAPELLTPTERYDFLAYKMLEGTITEKEREEGKKLELELFGMELGTFK